VTDRHYKALAPTEDPHQTYEPTWQQPGWQQAWYTCMHTIMALRGARHYACRSTPCESYVILNFIQCGACSQWPTTIYSSGQGKVPVPFQCTKLISIWFSLCLCSIAAHYQTQLTYHCH